MSTLTVATYNLYLGADLALLFGACSIEELTERAAIVRSQLDATDFAQRAEAIARILVREEVDVAGLQEVTTWASAPVAEDDTTGDPEPIVDFLPLLLAACEDAGADYEVHAVDRNFAGGLPVGDRWMSILGANVVLVRRGRASVTAERTGTFATTLDVPTGIDGVTFPVARGWGVVDLAVDGRRFVLANTHTEAYDPPVRDAQRNELLALLGNPGCPVAVVGDLNARPHDVGIAAPYVDAWSAAGGDTDGGLTCGQSVLLDNATSTLAERIDYVFVREAVVRECRTVGDRTDDRTRPGGLWPSDHAGVVARLEF